MAALAETRIVAVDHTTEVQTPWCPVKVLLISIPKLQHQAIRLVSRLTNNGLGDVSIIDLSDKLCMPIDLLDVRERIAGLNGGSVECQRLVLMNDQYPYCMHALLENSMGEVDTKVFIRACDTGIKADVACRSEKEALERLRCDSSHEQWPVYDVEHVSMIDIEVYSDTLADKIIDDALERLQTREALAYRAPLNADDRYGAIACHASVDQCSRYAQHGAAKAMVNHRRWEEWQSQLRLSPGDRMRWAIHGIPDILVGAVYDWHVEVGYIGVDPEPIADWLQRCQPTDVGGGGGAVAVNDRHAWQHVKASPSTEAWLFENTELSQACRASSVQPERGIADAFRNSTIGQFAVNESGSSADMPHPRTIQTLAVHQGLGHRNDGTPRAKSVNKQPRSSDDTPNVDPTDGRQPRRSPSPRRRAVVPAKPSPPALIAKEPPVKALPPYPPAKAAPPPPMIATGLVTPPTPAIFDVPPPQPPQPFKAPPEHLPERFRHLHHHNVAVVPPPQPTHIGKVPPPPRTSYTATTIDHTPGGMGVLCSRQSESDHRNVAR